MRLLVTGGAGYIGSIVAKQLLDAERTSAVVGEGFDGVLHFAALALVGESVSHPGLYYRTNVGGTLNLLEAMVAAGVPRLVFSSTCAVYGQPEKVPMDETTPPDPTNAYGASKLAVDGMISDFCVAHGLGAVSLRYFNVAGASRGAGEDHFPETHLIPNILGVVLGRLEQVEIYGTDYPTPDGTAIRDYIHIEDLGAAHVLALDGARPAEHRIFNLGNGNGFSVREVIAAAERVTGATIPAVERPRRPGDPPMLVAASERIRSELGWRAEKPELATILADAWAFHQANPTGYPD